MKFKVGDTVLVTGGKDKGKQGKILKVLREANRVVVEETNLYVKHIKPTNGQAGQRVKRPRPLPTANVAIINNEGKQDRIGYKIAKDGSKERIFKKTGKAVPEPKKESK
jgi:large subunit ribosomal protein L24